MRLAAICTALLALVGCAADPRPPLKTVASVDLSRIEGTWYVIAHIPYWLEEGKVATADVYRMRPDGRIDTTFVFRRGSFDAPEESWRGISWVHDRTTNAHWKVRFWWPFTIDYLVIDLDPDYRYLVVGHPSRDWFWILARARHLPPADFAAIVARAEAQGYDTARFRFVPQPGE